VRVLGVDPGAAGAIAFLQLANGLPVDLEVIDMPVLDLGKRHRVDERKLANEIDSRMKGELIFAGIIEQGGVRPQNGRVGVAAFWLGLGIVRGVLAANFIRIHEVSPAAWKRALRVTSDKDSSRMRASALFPRWADQWPLKKHHGRAEAALIALHGANTLPIQETRESA
jgi:crossover junction endodeoxyribonuclease RuvC